jgi:hypothetical protein
MLQSGSKLPSVGATRKKKKKEKNTDDLIGQSSQHSK